MFLPTLKTKKLGANSVFESDPGELCEVGKSQQSLKKSICEQITVVHWDSVPLKTTECPLCEWRSWGTCLPTVSVFMFAWSSGLFFQLVPQPPRQRGRKALGRRNHLQWCWWAFPVPVCFVWSLFRVIQLLSNETEGIGKGTEKASLDKKTVSRGF